MHRTHAVAIRTLLSAVIISGAGKISAAQSPLPPMAPPPPPIASANQPGNTAYTLWTEPKEHAFTVEVPVGWQVEGGVNWTSVIDAHPYLRLTNPDGKVKVFVGDPDILPRQVPTAITKQQTGASEGEQFRTAYGAPAVVLRYATGSQYAQQHSVWRSLCRNPRTVWSGDLKDETIALSNIVGAKAREIGAIGSASVGEAGFICDDAQGYVHAATVLFAASNQLVQIWGVFQVAGFVSSDPMQSMSARIITEHVSATFKSDAAWDRAFEEKNRQVTGSYISMQNANFELQQRAARSASSDLARYNHPMQSVTRSSTSTLSSSTNTTLGTRDVCDAIGRCKTVSNDADTFFMDHSGNVRAGRAGGAPPDNTGVWSPTFSRP